MTGMVGGALVTWTDPSRSELEEPSCAVSEEPEPDKPAWRRLLDYMVYDLLGAIDTWLVVGVLAAALISTWISPGYLATISWTQGIGGMLLALAISLPLYVCTTSSVPIAASLIAAGMPTGTALVFLMAGPATNIATMGAVYRALGGRVLAIYLGTVSVLSMAFGLLFDIVLPGTAQANHSLHHHSEAGLLSTAAAIVLAVLLLWTIGKKTIQRLGGNQATKGNDMDLVLKVKGMNCGHCVAAVKRAVEAEAGVTEAVPDLGSGNVAIRGEGLDRNAIVTRIENAGYKVEP